MRLDAAPVLMLVRIQMFLLAVGCSSEGDNDGEIRPPEVGSEFDVGVEEVVIRQEVDKLGDQRVDPMGHGEGIG